MTQMACGSALKVLFNKLLRIFFFGGGGGGGEGRGRGEGRGTI